MRQAVLIAARDELGCATRDETLLEALPTQADVLHLLATELRQHDRQVAAHAETVGPR